MKIQSMPILFALIAGLLIFTGFAQSWNVALAILNLCLISAIMTLGVNIQWGYAGIVNFGVMGFAALGGLAGVLVSIPPVLASWQAGGIGLLSGGDFGAEYRSLYICGTAAEAVAEFAPLGNRGDSYLRLCYS